MARAPKDRPACKSAVCGLTWDFRTVGKTHLAISLAIAAAQSGRRVYYGTLADLITSLEEAQAAGRLQARLKVLTHPALLVASSAPGMCKSASISGRRSRRDGTALLMRALPSAGRTRRAAASRR